MGEGKGKLPPVTRHIKSYIYTYTYIILYIHILYYVKFQFCSHWGASTACSVQCEAKCAHIMCMWKAPLSIQLSQVLLLSISQYIDQWGSSPPPWCYSEPGTVAIALPYTLHLYSYKQEDVGWSTSELDDDMLTRLTPTGYPCTPPPWSLHDIAIIILYVYIWCWCVAHKRGSGGVVYCAIVIVD